MLRRGTRPHLIRLDPLMPRMDGWTLYRENNKGMPLARIPMIVRALLDREGDDDPVRDETGSSRAL
jgi:CheY-like chemotaxis protein